MKKKLKYSLLLFFVYSLFQLHHALAAETFTVYSEYNVSSGETRSRNWNVVMETSSEDSVNLKFFPEGSGSVICEINNTLSGDIRFSSPVRTMSGSDGLLIVPAFPAPCDILPLHEEKDTEENIYKAASSAGGRIFEKQYTISYEDIDSDNALKEGWLKSGLSTSAELKLVTARDEQGRTVVKQLWPKNGKWWLYEETANRRSWRIP